MKNKLVFLLATSVALIFSSCNKGGKTGLLIPKGADMVLHINLPSLSSKLSWQEMSKTGWFTDLQKLTRDPFTRKIIEDPETSGIDAGSAIVIFTKNNSNRAYIAAQGKIKNTGQFKTSLEQFFNGQNTQKDGSLNTVEIPSGGVLYFNNKTFAIVTDISEAKEISGKRSISQMHQSYSIDSLKYFAKNIFSIEGDDLLDSDERFVDLIGEKADMHYWVKTGILIEPLLANSLPVNFSSILSGNFSAGTINFENGKIISDARHYFNGQITDLFTKYAGKEIGDDALAKLPDEAMAAFAMNFNPEFIRELLKTLNLDGLANAALMQLGTNFTMDDFIRANGGELAFAVTGLSMQNIPATVTLGNGQVIPYMDEKTQLQYTFGASVNDKPAFQKLADGINNLKSTGMVSFLKDPLQMKLQDKWFALGPDGAGIDSFLNRNKKPAYTSLFSGHSGGGYADLQKLITASGASKTGAEKNLYGISAGFWKNAVLFWDIKSDFASSHFEMNLADEKTNSLKQLNQYANTLYKATPVEEDFEPGIN